MTTCHVPPTWGGDEAATLLRGHRAVQLLVAGVAGVQLLVSAGLQLVVAGAAGLQLPATEAGAREAPPLVLALVLPPQRGRAVQRRQVSLGLAAASARLRGLARPRPGAAGPPRQAAQPPLEAAEEAPWLLASVSGSDGWGLELAAGWAPAKVR